MVNYIVTGSVVLLALVALVCCYFLLNPFKKSKGKKGEVVDFESWKRSKSYKGKRAN